MDEAAAEARWRALAEKAVGGSLDLLRGATDEGLAIEPLYRRSTTAAPQPWRARDAWAVSQRVDHPLPGPANDAALLELEGGADALTLVTAGSAFARGFGLDAAGAVLDTALAGVDLDLISLRLDAGRDTVAAATALADLAAARRLTSAALDVDLGCDPIGRAARDGQAWQAAELTQVMEAAHRGGFAGRPLLADGRPYHEAGAGEAQELAAVLATAVAYLRHLDFDGLDAARRAVAVLLAVDADMFLGIAKLRAMRRLWARVEAACGLDPRPLRLHAETSWRMMTRRDPHVNVMRAVAATTAAGLGGADAVTVLPMTLALGLPDDAARRLARNVSRVLIDEANLAKVDDAAAGSGGLDALTDGLCARAWALFQDIEAAGGIEAALAGAGGLRAAIAATAAKRRSGIASLARGLVGTSRFASLGEPAPHVLDVPRRPEPRPHAALPSHRDAEPFEALRDRAEAGGKAPPVVFLAPLGAPAAYGTRAAAAANVLAAAGLAAVPAADAQGTLGARFAASGTLVACLCGTDAAYAADGAAALAALRANGATRVLMAGDDEAWRRRGVDDLLHDGANMLDVLSSTLDAMGR